MDKNPDLDNYIRERLKFPKTLNVTKWKEYLGRNLTFEERYFIVDFKAEIHMNKLMANLYEKCKTKNMFVPKLSLTDGNCMFDSLNYHKIGHDVQSLRAGLAILLYIFADIPNFFPTVGTTIKEMFIMMNEIELVRRSKKIYIANDNIHDNINDNNNFDNNLMIEEEIADYCKYTFDAMCQDLCTTHAWSRLPTELILTFISMIYKVEIVIINSNNDYEHTINADPDNIKNKIYLGHLGEAHYVPLDTLPTGEILKPIYYESAQATFLKWAHEIENHKINFCHQQLEEMNNEKSNNFEPIYVTQDSQNEVIEFKDEKVGQVEQFENVEKN